MDEPTSEIDHLTQRGGRDGTYIQSKARHGYIYRVERKYRPEQYLLLGPIFIGPGNVNNELGI